MSSSACSPAVAVPYSPNSMPSYALQYEKGNPLQIGNDAPLCTFHVKNEDHWRSLTRSDAYQVAQAFVNRDFDVTGDLVQAIKVYRVGFAEHSRVAFRTLVTYLGHQMRRRFRGGSSARDIQFHYDRSNEFYSNFLDSKMVYSCGYFRTPDDSLEQAQLAKLDHICRKLQLQQNDRFLDVGCGWGALLIRGAERYGSVGTGCTLSIQQRDWAIQECQRRNLTERISVFQCDYSQLDGEFDKIASIGMFEHVGLKPLQRYFNKVFRLLKDGGCFLNHGIVRPSIVKTGPETLFLIKDVFPGGELVRLIDVIRAGEAAGFEVIDVENLRPHYALTCRAWVNNLQKNSAQCLKCVDQTVYRTWLLYLAACADSFEAGQTEIHQVLFTKRAGSRPLTRNFIYGA